MTGPDTPRRRWNVGLSKLPAYQRTISHDVVGTTDEAWVERGYLDVIGSDSDTAQGLAKHPYGSDVVYSVELTDEEAERFAEASNLRYIEEDRRHPPARYVARPTGAPSIPTLATLGWMRARYVDLRRWHGRDVPVAVLDQGTTQAVRNVMGFTLVARTNIGSALLGPGQELVRPEYAHGCLVAGNAVPAGGRLLDCIIIDDDGAAFESSIAAGIRWAVDNGAKVANCSFGGAPGVTSQVIQDACAYARDNGGAQVVFGTGNDNLADISSMSSASRLFAGVHSSIAFDESTDRRALFSNHASDASGCGAGVDVTSLDIYGNLVHWNGTSASAPHMAHLMARALTGAQFTPAQVGAAFKANARDTGAGASEQGAGAYDLHRALTALGAVPAAVAGVATPTHLDSRGGSSSPSAWSIAPAVGVAVDDMQLVVLVSSVDAGIVVPPGWSLLTDAAYYGGWELSQGIPVGPTRVRVLAAAYTAAQPASVTVSFGGGTWFSALAIITVRGAGGMDPERFAPVVRFGTSASATAVPTVPATTNDLQLCVFSQRHPTATTGTLSLPAGLTQRGFWRPSSGTTGYTLLAATVPLTSAARTPTYTSTSNDATGTWAAVTLTIPGGGVPGTPVVQTELAGPPGSYSLFLPSAGSYSPVPFVRMTLADVPRLRGVNWYGMEDGLRGPTPAELRDFVARGYNIVRLPVSYSTTNSAIAAVLADADAAHIWVGVEVHNYGRIGGTASITATDGTVIDVSNQSTWWAKCTNQLAAFSSYISYVPLDMNEPKQTGAQWQPISQGRVTALRNAGWTGPIGVSAAKVSSAGGINNSDAHPNGWWITDTNSFLEVHHYLQPLSDATLQTRAELDAWVVSSSGQSDLTTYVQYVNRAFDWGAMGDSRWTNVPMLTGEFAMPPGCEAELNAFLAKVDARRVGAIEWGAGMWGTYNWKMTEAQYNALTAHRVGGGGSFTGGSGGPLTDRTSVSYSNGTKTSTYHIYAAGLDWSKRVGLLVYGDGSGEQGLSNTASTYLMAGTTGLIAVAKKNNMVLVTPRAPGNGCTDGDGVCWYLPSNDSTTLAQKTKWLDDLIKTQVLPLYNVDKTRVCISGFSSGAELTMGTYGPPYAASWMEDGLLLAISYGSPPSQFGITPTYTAAFRAKVAAVWDIRGGDETTAVADGTDGFNWYRTTGFATTQLNIIPGGQHDRPGEFGGIVDQYIAQYVVPTA